MSSKQGGADSGRKRAQCCYTATPSRTITRETWCVHSTPPFRYANAPPACVRCCGSAPSGGAQQRTAIKAPVSRGLLQASQSISMPISSLVLIASHFVLKLRKLSRYQNLLSSSRARTRGSVSSPLPTRAGHFCVVQRVCAAGRMSQHSAANVGQAPLFKTA